MKLKVLHDIPMHRNFKLEDFRCRCGCGLGYYQMQPEAIRLLFKTRDEGGVPMIVTSAIRCEAHNLRVGGGVNSAHLRGYAIDAQWRNRSEAKVMLTAITANFPRVGINFQKEFFHMDCDPSLPTPMLFPY